MDELWKLYGITYRACNCRVWPIVNGHSWGRCGACKVRPELVIEASSREEATAKWKKNRKV